MVQERNRIQLPLEEIKLAFAASCVEGTAEKATLPTTSSWKCRGDSIKSGCL